MKIDTSTESKQNKCPKKARIEAYGCSEKVSRMPKQLSVKTPLLGAYCQIDRSYGHLERTSIEKIPSLDWPVGISGVHFLD